MPRKKKTELSFIEKMMKWKNSGLSKPASPNRLICYNNEIEKLDVRIQRILQIVNHKSKKAGNMLFFVMYDIQNTKVRTQVAKYLLRQGCNRVQHSIFLADLESAKYEQIKNDLAEVQSCYENHDSILIVPISTDLLSAMKIIGVNINLDLIIKSSGTLFF